MKFVFDLDGTLCFDGYTIPQVIQKALQQVKDSGHELLFATARSYRDCIALLGDELAKETVIGLNGGLLYREGQLVWYRLLDKLAYQEALSFCHLYNLPYFVDDAFDYTSSQMEKMPFAGSVDPLALATRKSVEELHYPIKMVIEMSSHQELVEDFCHSLKQLETVAVQYHEHEKCLYLNPLNTTKATTVVDQISSDFVVFGNDKNDIELFEASLYGVQVGDYKPLERYADEKVSSHPEQIAQKIKAIATMFQPSNEGDK